VGSYLTTTELKTRFEDDAELEFLTDVTEGSGPDDAVLTDVIETAEGEINSGLAKKYATPVDVSADTTLAALLKRKTLDLAEVYLHRRGEGASEIKQDQLDQVMEWVEKMATGARVLVGALTPASTASADPRATWTDTGRELPDTSARIFTRQSGGRL
jgi:phage gp36-like protein